MLIDDKAQSRKINKLLFLRRIHKDLIVSYTGSKSIKFDDVKILKSKIV